MARDLVRPEYPRAIRDLVNTAAGVAHRADPAQGRSGGPSGNARLTAWVGLVLLALFLVEGVTLLSLHQLISVHLLVGTLLVPVALLKTATTGWRMFRYYTGHPAYRIAGPPPLVLRLLGPLVVLSALAVLGSGLALVALGTDGSFEPLLSVGPLQVSALTVHQASFAAWLVIVGLHVLARTIPALQLTSRRGHPRAPSGAFARGAVVAVTLVVGLVAGVAVVHAATSWTTRPVFSHDGG